MFQKIKENIINALIPTEEPYDGDDPVIIEWDLNDEHRHKTRKELCIYPEECHFHKKTESPSRLRS